MGAFKVYEVLVAVRWLFNILIDVELGGGKRAWMGGEWSRGFKRRGEVKGLEYIGRMVDGAEGGAVVYGVGEPMVVGEYWRAEEEGRSVVGGGRGRGVWGRVAEMGGMPEGGRGD